MGARGLKEPSRCGEIPGLSAGKPIGFRGLDVTIEHKIRSAGLTNVGLKREHNEDNLLVAEDLNRDEIRYRAIKLPRYSEFDEDTGRFRWRPRGVQKGPNDVSFEIIDSRGGITIHEFQVHVFEDPSRRQFLFTSWPLMLAFVGMIFVLGLTVGP